MDLEFCFTENFNGQLKGFDKLKIGNTYDLSNIFDCKDWDEAIFIGSPMSSRLAILFSSGVLLPEINYEGLSDQAIILYLIKDNKIISKRLILDHPNFFFSQNLNRLNYLVVEKNNSKFAFKKFDNDYYDLFTLELIDKSLSIDDIISTEQDD